MDETREPKFTGHAAKIFRELNQDPSGERMWKELKARTPGTIIPEQGPPIFIESTPARKETERFSDLRKILELQDWQHMLQNLKAMDLNDDDLDSFPNQDGLELPVEETFAQLAADLREFDPEGIRKDYDLNHKQFLDLRSYAETLRDNPLEFIKFCYNLKTLFSASFKSLPISEQIWQEIASHLETASVSKDWERFLQVYEQAHFVSDGNIQKYLPIGQGEWAEILKFIKNYRRGSYQHGRFSALAQAIRPHAYAEVQVAEADWDGYVHDLYALHKNEKNPWVFIQRARALKYLRLGP